MSTLKKIQHCFLLILIGMFFITADAQAGWFDSFTKSVVSNPASSWTLQQQSHYAAGGFSVRFNSESRPFMNITAPKISVGCGGIDAFWGGFSFLNPEYFIQMFRNILAAAPAFAFKLALESLCPSCADVLDTLTELANIMNSMAMDECGAAQALGYAGGAAIASIFGGKADGGKSDGSGSEWLESLKKYAGQANEFLEDIKNRLEEKFCGFLDGAAKDLCKKVYTTSGTLWERAVELDRMKNMKGNRTLDDEYVAVFRAIVGDIEMTHGHDKADSDGKKQKDPTLPAINPVKPCPGASAEALFEVMINNKDEEIYLQPTGNGVCTKGALPNSLKVTEKAVRAIAEIKSKIFTKGESLTPETIEVVSENALPIYKMINLFALRVTTKGNEFMTGPESEMMAELAAIGHAAYIINTSMVRASSIIAYIASELSPAVFESGGIVTQLGEARDSMLKIIAHMSAVFNSELGRKERGYKEKIQAIFEVQHLQLNYEASIVKSVLRNM